MRTKLVSPPYRSAAYSVKNFLTDLRIMCVQFFTFVGVLLLVASFVEPTSASEAYPIWISPDLGTGSRTDLERKLSRPWVIDIFLSSRGEIGTRETSCGEYLETADRQFPPWHIRGFDLWSAHVWYWLADCVELAYLKRAQPSKTSHVRNFMLSNDSPSVLPIVFPGPLSCQSLAEIYDGQPPAKTWAESRALVFEAYPASAGKFAEKNVKLFVDREANLGLRAGKWECCPAIDNSTVYYTSDTIHVMRLQAMADFNGDGNEDLLLRDDYRLVGHALGSSDVYVLTRDSVDGALRDIRDAGSASSFPGWLSPIDGQMLLLKSAHERLLRGIDALGVDSHTAFDYVTGLYRKYGRALSGRFGVGARPCDEVP